MDHYAFTVPPVRHIIGLVTSWPRDCVTVRETEESLCAQDVLSFIHPVTWRVFFKVSARKKQANNTFNILFFLFLWLYYFDKTLAKYINNTGPIYWRLLLFWGGCSRGDTFTAAALNGHWEWLRFLNLCWGHRGESSPRVLFKSTRTSLVASTEPFLYMLKSRFTTSSRTTRRLTCPRHPSEAEAAPHPWPLLARGRPCRRSATWRAAPPEDRRLEDDSDRTRIRLLMTDDRNAGESEQEMRWPARFMMKVLEALASWAFSNSLRRISGGSRTQRFRCCSSSDSADTSKQPKNS